MNLETDDIKGPLTPENLSGSIRSFDIIKFDPEST